MAYTVRIAGETSETDGVIDNVTRGDDTAGGSETDMIRAKLLLKLSALPDFELMASYTDDDRVFGQCLNRDKAPSDFFLQEQAIDGANIAGVDGTVDYDQFLPKLGASYHIAEEQTVSAFVQRGYPYRWRCTGALRRVSKLWH
ncbi:MAG: hypothetical protein AAGI11_13225 [Pseudomonadota bacterium]